MDARAVILQAHRVAHYYNMVVLGYKGCETTQVYLGVLDTTTWSDSQEFQDNVAAIKDLVTHRVWLARELAMGLDVPAGTGLEGEEIVFVGPHIKAINFGACGGLYILF